MKTLPDDQKNVYVEIEYIDRGDWSADVYADINRGGRIKSLRVGDELEHIVGYIRDYRMNRVQAIEHGKELTQKLRLAGYSVEFKHENTQ